LLQKGKTTLCGKAFAVLFCFVVTQHTKSDTATGIVNQKQIYTSNTIKRTSKPGKQLNQLTWFAALDMTFLMPSFIIIELRSGYSCISARS